MSSVPKFVRIMLTETCAPAVFDDKESVKPAKVVQLESVDISDPVHKRPEQQFMGQIRPGRAES